LFDIVKEAVGGPDQGERLGWFFLKPAKVSFFRHNFVQFGKQHTPYKAICRPIFCHSCVVKYVQPSDKVNPWWDLTVKYYWNRPHKIY